LRCDALRPVFSDQRDFPSFLNNIMTISLPLLAGILLTGAGLGYALGRWGHGASVAAIPVALESPAGAKMDVTLKGVVPALMLADLKAVAAGAGTAAPNVALLSLVEEALLMEPESLRCARLTWLFYSMTPVDMEGMNAKFGEIYSNRGQNLRAESAIFREHQGRLDGVRGLQRWDKDNNGWAEGRMLLAREIVIARPDLAERLLKDAEGMKFPAEIRKGIVLGLLAVDPAAATSLMVEHAGVLQPEAYAGELADLILTKRGIETAAQWLNDAKAAGQSPAFLSAAGEGLQAKVLTRMSPEAWVAFLNKATGPVWPGPAELPATAEMLAKRAGGNAKDQVQVWGKFLPVWMKRKIDGPAQWLQKKAGTPGYDAAVAAFVKEIQPVDAAAAKAWADTIQNPEFKSLVK
jgi:hypothetical protein